MNRIPFLALVWVLLGSTVGADPLRFLFQTGDQYRYYGTSTQRVTINGTFVQDSLLSYRIAFSVVETDAAGRGHLQGRITYLTQPVGNAASAVTQEYETDYWVDSRGYYEVPRHQVMPVVRNVPTFPDTDLVPGATWTGKGEEVHDLRDDFGVNQLLRIPFEVVYTDEGPTVRDGKDLRAIGSVYTLYHRTGLRLSQRGPYPTLMTGSSRQTHFFNVEKGREEGYEEVYDLALKLSNGQVNEYAGSGESHLVEARTMDKPAVVEQVQKGLEDRGLGNVEVKAGPKGVVINLDNIRFPGESAVLVPSEQQKLRLIGEVLKQYPDRDILVEGHTADAATATDPQVLSEARAAAVVKQLVAEGVRPAQKIIYRGWGATRPVAPNDTEAGRAKNRRVEITLLEN